MATATQHYTQRDRRQVDGDAIRQIRRALRWSPTKLAAELGVSERTLNRYESGRIQPPKQIVTGIVALAIAGNVDLAVVRRLFADTDAPPGGDAVTA